jgi:hypothetical protein
MDRNPVSSSKVSDFLWIWFIKMSKNPIPKIRVLIAFEPKFASNKPDANVPTELNSERWKLSDRANNRGIWQVK